MADLERQLKPYRDQFPSFRELPPEGLARTEVTGLVEQLASAEERTWREGYASGATLRALRAALVAIRCTSRAPNSAALLANSVTACTVRLMAGFCNCRDP